MNPIPPSFASCKGPVPPSVSPNYRGEVNQPGRPDDLAAFRRRLDDVAARIRAARDDIRRGTLSLAEYQARHDRILVSWENGRPQFFRS